MYKNDSLMDCGYFYCPYIPLDGEYDEEEPQSKFDVEIFEIPDEAEMI